MSQVHAWRSVTTLLACEPCARRAILRDRCWTYPRESTMTGHRFSRSQIGYEGNPSSFFNGATRKIPTGKGWSQKSIGSAASEIAMPVHVPRLAEPSAVSQLICPRRKKSSASRHPVSQTRLPPGKARQLLFPSSTLIHYLWHGSSD